MKSFYLILLSILIVPAAFANCSATDIVSSRQIVESSQAAYDAAEAALLEQQMNTPKNFVQSRFQAETRRLTEAKNRAFENLRAARLCLFRAEIRDEIVTIGNTENAQWMEGLQEVGNCLGIQPAASILNDFGGFFRNLFNSFMNKPSLSNNDCQVLQRAYEVWSSMYDDLNDSQEKISGIPLYNVNAHNASFYHWANEQRKGRIPPGGLTILHADTHTDMGHVHRHINHWSQSVMNLETAQQVTMMKDSEVQGYMIERVRQATAIPASDRNNILARLRVTPPQQLKSEIASAIRGNVHGIAQPLAAAQAVGVSNGRYLMCMPPWSSELPRSARINSEGKNIPEPLEMDFCNANIEGLASGQGIKGGNLTIGFAVPDAAKYEETTLVRYWEGECEVRGKSYFNVVDCNNEELYERGRDSTGKVEYDVRQKAAPTNYKFQDYLSPKDREQGFLLDIDLDVFVSEGRGKRDPMNPEPSSFLRPHGEGVKPHGSHEASNETSTAPAVSVRELEQIRSRVDDFMKRLQSAKADGYSPKVITIADSTILRRALLNQESNDLAGGNFTPVCLSFLLNYMVKTQLS